MSDGEEEESMAETEKVTAYHEAGHMVAAWELGLDVTGASIVPNPEEGYAGYVRIPVYDRLRYAEWVNEDDYLYAHLVVLNAGIAASEIYTGAPMTEAEIQIAVQSPGSDHYGTGYFILEIAGPDEEKQSQVMVDAERRAKFLIHVRWAFVEKVADVLLERQTLGAEECREALREIWGYE